MEGKIDRDPSGFAFTRRVLFEQDDNLVERLCSAQPTNLRDKEVHAGAGEVEAGGGGQGVIGDEQIDHAERRDLDAHVRHEGGVVGDQDDLAGGADHGLLDGNLGDGVMGEAEIEGDAADHQEELVGAQLIERHFGGGADQGLGAGAQRTPGGDEDDAGLAIQYLKGVHGIGDDGDVAGAFQFLGEHA